MDSDTPQRDVQVTVFFILSIFVKTRSSTSRAGLCYSQQKCTIASYTVHDLLSLCALWQHVNSVVTD